MQPNGLPKKGYRVFVKLDQAVPCRARALGPNHLIRLIIWALAHSTRWATNFVTFFVLLLVLLFVRSLARSAVCLFVVA